MRLPMAPLLLLLTLPVSAAENFVPISVWYGGGKARAPMLERDPRAKKELWRADLNHAEAPKTANFALALTGRIRDVETGQPVKATSEGGRLRISRELPANGVAVLAVR